jgi:hypothetical protein
MSYEVKELEESVINPIVATVLSRISVPMDTRPHGGTFEGILLSGQSLSAVERALTEELEAEFRETGGPSAGMGGGQS